MDSIYYDILALVRQASRILSSILISYRADKSPEFITRTLFHALLSYCVLVLKRTLFQINVGGEIYVYFRCVEGGGEFFKLISLSSLAMSECRASLGFF